MLLTDTIRTDSVEVSDYDRMIGYPLNLARMASWRLENEVKKEGRTLLDVFSWHDDQSRSLVVAVKSEGIEKWD